MPRASEDSIALAREVLAKIAAYDPYFPRPNPATLTAWAEHISLKNPDRDDMLTAVTQFYATNTDGVKPLPASISAIASAIRLDRLQRMNLNARADTEARIDAKAEGRRYQPELGRAPEVKLSLAEWEARNNTKFPRVEVTKPVPQVRMRHVVEGSGHVCEIPRRVPKGATWRCEESDCGQEWMEFDGKWVMCDG